MAISGEPSLVGRATELERMRSLLSRAEQGAGSWIVVEGEPGIGKSALVGALVGEAHRRGGVWVVSATAEELDGDRPFAIFDDALGLEVPGEDPERAAISDLLHGRDHAAVPLVDVRFKIIERIADLIERIAAEMPLLVVFEDVHWADPSSVVAIHRLVRRVAWAPVLVVVTCRTLPRRAELALLIAEAGDTNIVRLEPLDDEAVMALTSIAVGAELGDRLRRQMSTVGGNPLFAGELVGELIDERAIELRDGVAELAEGVLTPPSLRLTIVTRLSFLPEATLDALNTASVLGSRFSLDYLATTTGELATALLRKLQPAIDAGVVSPDGDALRFRHDVVRDALYLEMAQGVRDALHRQVALRLAARGAPANVVAAHISIAARPGDQEAVDWLLRAGRESMATAPTTAADLLERAAALLEPGSSQRDAILLETLFVLSLSEPDRSMVIAQELRSRQTSGDQIEMLDSLTAFLYFIQGRMTELCELVVDRLGTESIHDRRRLPRVVMAEAARVAVGRTTAIEASARFDGLEDFVVAHPRSLAAIAAGMLRSAFAACTGRFDEAVAHAARGRHAVDARFLLAESLYGGLLALADDFERCRDQLERSRVNLEQAGAVAFLPTYEHWRAYASFAEGRWDDALAEIGSARDIGGVSGVGMVASVAPDPCVYIHAHRGDLAAAEKALRDANNSTRDSLHIDWFWTGSASALIASLAGDGPGAVSAFRRWHVEVQRMGFLPDFRDSALELLRLARAESAHDVGATLVADTAEAARRSSVASVHGLALLCRGVVDGDGPTLLAAVDTLRASPRRFLFAEACEAAGLGLLEFDRGTALRLVEEARTIYDDFGATHDVARLRAELRSHGVRTGARGRRARPTIGWESLTPSELAVVALIVKGLSNPEIAQQLYISRSTVTAHLSNAFRKLAVSSRTELTALAVRHETA